MDLKSNQSALILEIDEHGEVSVDVVSGDHEGLTAAICSVIAEKLMGDDEFTEEIMDCIDIEDED